MALLKRQLIALFMANAAIGESCTSLCCNTTYCQTKLAPHCQAIADACCTSAFGDQQSCNNCLTSTAQKEGIPSQGIPIGDHLQVVSIFGTCGEHSNGAQDCSQLPGCMKKNCGEVSGRLPSFTESTSLFLQVEVLIFAPFPV
jgi:hypothetical protein